jgi:hypothetical protein
MMIKLAFKKIATFRAKSPKIMMITLTPDQHRQLDVQVVLQGHDDALARLLGHRQQQAVLRGPHQLRSGEFRLILNFIFAYVIY